MLRLTREDLQILTDPTRAVSASCFPVDRASASHPGLYSWWVDDLAQRVFAQQLAAPIPELIYAGQAGGTKKPSGAGSSATLLSRIRGNHVSGSVRSSTFHLTITTLLLDPLRLAVVAPSRLAPSDRLRVTNWLGHHLRVAVLAYPDRDVLIDVEEELLGLLDPPLNLAGRPPTPVRTRLAVLRSRVTHPSPG